VSTPTQGGEETRWVKRARTGPTPTQGGEVDLSAPLGVETTPTQGGEGSPSSGGCELGVLASGGSQRVLVPELSGSQAHIQNQLGCFTY
jgi:hypothetical protein